MSSKLKLVAAVSVVLVTLSGFAPARSGGRGGFGGDGGGCSSSSSGSHNSSDYDSDYDGGSDYDSGSSSGSGYDSGSASTTGSGSTGSGSTSGGGGYAKTTKRFTAGDDGYVIVRITRCAGASPGSDVELESHVTGDDFAPTYRVRIKYTDQSGNYVDSGESTLVVGNGETNDTYVTMNDVGRLDDVAACEVESLTEES